MTFSPSVALSYYKREKKGIHEVLKIALPTIGDMFVQTLLGFFDMFMVGKIGAEAINAVGVGNTPILLLSTVFFALSTGTTAIVSRAYGSGNKTEGRRSTIQSFILSFPIAIIITLIFLFFGKNLLNFIGAGDNLPLSLQYYNAVILGLPFMGMNIIFSALYRSVGDAQVPMFTNILSVATNIFFNYVFIFIFSWGVLGAGIATTIARFLVTGIYFYLMFIKKSFWVKLSLKKMFYHRDTALRILKIGLPAALEQGLFRIGMMIFEMLVIRLGTVAYASHKIALTAESFSFNLGLGFAVAATSLVGQQLGKNSVKEAEKYVYICTILSIFVMTLFALAFLLIPTQIISLFTNDSDIIDLASRALWVVSFCQPFLAVSMVLSGSLRGAGSTKSVLFITAAGMYLI
ncbi:MAG: MATE family efflux transporter, partial [Fusobacteriaceae bacterium]